jgi:hypothetical protein
MNLHSRQTMYRGLELFKIRAVPYFSAVIVRVGRRVWVRIKGPTKLTDQTDSNPSGEKVEASRNGEAIGLSVSSQGEVGRD